MQQQNNAPPKVANVFRLGKVGEGILLDLAYTKKNVHPITDMDVERIAEVIIPEGLLMALGKEISRYFDSSNPVEKADREE